VCRPLGVLLFIFCLSADAWSRLQTPIQQEALPSRIDDAVFWKMISEFSEPGGAFRLENFMSNEKTYQSVLPVLEPLTALDGAYIGVGPEQNFSYILSLRPAVSFIIDIRRQNLMEHLLYKVLFEVSENRSEFLAKLFSRSLPKRLGPDASLAAIFQELSVARPDPSLYERNTAAVLDHLIRVRRFPLNDADQDLIKKVYRAFFTCGPEMDFHCLNPGGGYGAGLTFADLMQQDDGRGKNRGFLATEVNFRYIQETERRNLIIPIVGDFGGPKAIRAVGDYLRQHHAIAKAFYISNVEDYLFPYPAAWQMFYQSVAALPLDERSTFIRVVQQAQYASVAGIPAVSGEWVILLSPISRLIEEFRGGQIQSQRDVIRLSK